MAKRCPACNADNQDNARLCEYCGTKFPSSGPEPAQTPERARFCSSCGKELIPDAPFCRFCGAKVNGSATLAQTTRQNSAPARQTPSSQGLPAYMQHGYQEQVRAQRQAVQNGTKTKKSTRGLSLFLSLLLAVQFCIAGFKYPGFLLKKNGGDGPAGGGTGSTSDGGIASFEEIRAYQTDVMEYLGIGEEELNEYLSCRMEVTPENSPGNPALIDVSYSDAERAAAKTASATVTTENPEADFPQFGIHINLKEWNLDNETDTLTVRQLPVKTDAVTGSELYIYDYSLASGQHEFYTNVEITVPVQGDPSSFFGFVWRNEETGAWEDVYCELSEDGKQVTAFVDHFSDEGQQSLDTLRREADTVAGMTTVSGSVFNQAGWEMKPMFENAEHYLYPVSLSKFTEVEMLVDNETPTSRAFFETLMKTGGIPAETSFTEWCSTLGFLNDTASTGVFLLDKTGKTLEKCPGFVKGAGYALAAVGTALLTLRVGNQAIRKVEAQKIVKTNKSSWISNVITVSAVVAELGGAAATGTTAAVLTFGSTALSAVCAAMFVYSTVGAGFDWVLDKLFPAGQEDNLEDGAYHYFLSEYAMKYGLADEYGGKISEDLDCTNYPWKLLRIQDKKAWTRVLKTLFKKYKDDPAKLQKSVETICDNFINTFWDEPDKVRENLQVDCWYEFARTAPLAVEITVPPGAEDIYKRFGYQSATITQDLIQKSCVRAQSIEERQRRFLVWGEVNYEMEEQDLTWDQVFDLGFDTEDEERLIWFDRLTQKQIDGYKEKARNILYMNINPIIEDYYRTEHAKAVTEIRTRLFNEVLPLLNTRIAFFEKDKDRWTYVPQQIRPLFNTAREFAFEGDRKTLFVPGNRDSIDYVLNLKMNYSNPVLLETTVYYYMMFGCPDTVTVTDPTNGNAKSESRAVWDNVELNLSLYARKVSEMASENYLMGDDSWLKSLMSDSLPFEPYSIFVPIEPTKAAPPSSFTVSSTGSSSPGMKWNLGSNAFSDFYMAYHAATEKASGTADKNGNVNITGSATYVSDYGEDVITATVTFTATATVDPNTGKGTCTVSGTGTISQKWINAEYNPNTEIDDSSEKEHTVSFTGSGTATLKNGVYELKTENTKFSVSGTSTYYHHKGGSDSSTQNFEYTHDSYGGWGITISLK